MQLPIFQGGRIRADIDSAEAVLNRSELEYQQSVLNALTEVENNLTQYSNQRKTLTRLAKAVAASEQAANTAQRLYADGLVNFINVLQAQRELTEVQNEYAKQKTATATSLIALYKALGGGWQV